MTNRRRRHAGRYTPPRNHRQGPPRLYSIGWYGPDGEEIEIDIDIDLNDPTADPFLVDLIHRMTDNCPHCNGAEGPTDSQGDG